MMGVDTKIAAGFFDGVASTCGHTWAVVYVEAFPPFLFQEVAAFFF